MITITKKRYYDLLIAEETLDRLECGGVDNWEWYDESLGDDMEEFESELWDEIMEKENIKNESNNVPKKLQTLMYGLIKEARRESFVEFCEYWNIDYETDYEEIKQWFKTIGIKV